MALLSSLPRIFSSFTQWEIETLPSIYTDFYKAMYNRFSLHLKTTVGVGRDGIACNDEIVIVERAVIENKALYLYSFFLSYPHFK